MPELPAGITLEDNRDLRGRSRRPWYRRALLCCVAVLPVLALLNVFGQRPETSTGAAAAAHFSVSAPSRVRGGLLYQARFNITARKTLDQAELVLAQGWIHDLTINTMEPSPASQSSHDGKLGLDLGPIAAGQTYVLFVDYQVNPTNVGRQDQTVTLYDGNRALVTLHRTLTVFP